jgi:hypothetical protein
MLSFLSASLSQELLIGPSNQIFFFFHIYKHTFYYNPVMVF